MVNIVRVDHKRPWIEKKKTSSGRVLFYVRTATVLEFSDGTKVAEKGYYGTSTEAEEQAQALKEKVSKEVWNIQNGIASKREVSVAKLVDEFMADNKDKGLEESTRRMYKRSVDLFASRCGAIDVHMVTKDTIRDFRNWLKHTQVGGFRQPKRPRNNTGINMIMRDLRRLFNYAVGEEYIDRNPVHDFINKAGWEKTKAAWRLVREDEFRNLLDVGCQDNPELGKFLEVLRYTGMRHQEALFLRGDEIWDGVIHLDGTRSKNKKPRNIPVFPEIERILNGVSSGQVFSKWSSMSAVYNALSSAKKRAGITGRLRPHDFRHTCATWLLATLGWPIEQVSKFLGHSSVSITSAIYSHEDLAQMKRLVSQPRELTLREVAPREVAQLSQKANSSPDATP